MEGIESNDNQKNRINEVFINDSFLIKLDTNIIQVSHSICKIQCKNLIGTGFFIKLKTWNQQELFFLMTNEHVIKREFVESKENIEILYDCGKKEHQFLLNKDKRFIKDYKDKNIDIIIIQILEEDNINKIYFLSPYMGEISHLIGNKIYIPQFPKGESLCLSKGYILRTNYYELAHSASTEQGSSGSPIFLENTSEVIAIHKQGHLLKQENYGNFIYPIIESLKVNNEYNQIENYSLRKKEFNIYIYDNSLITYSQFTSNGKNNKYNIYINEIISDNNSSEYYRECFSGIVLNYAYCENSNWQYRKYMEDQGKAIENLNSDQNKILFCIFDGHGGGQVSKFLQDNFPIYMKKAFPFKNIYESIVNIFRLLDERIKLLNVPNDGSTGTIVYIEKQNENRILHCANVGNSRCVLVNRKGIMRMSQDDKIDDPKEYNRIIKKGGIIYNGCLNGILTLSRSFGDWAHKNQELIAEPHIASIKINKDDLYLIIASDGVWDVIKDEECKGFMELFGDTFNNCKNLVKECLNRGSTDNVSCFVIRLN